MVEIARKWMERMGIRNTQYIIARHYDTQHPHCHLVFNRIDNDGNLISDSNERIRSTKVCRALTEEYGLYLAPKNSKARNKNRLRPHQLRKLNLRSATLDALAESHSWKDFLSALKVRNIDIRFNRNQVSDKVHGVSFSQDGISLAGSTLDRDLSFNSLCTTLGNLTEELLLQPHQPSFPVLVEEQATALDGVMKKTRTAQRMNLFINPLNVEDDERRCYSRKSRKFASKCE